MRLNVRPVIFRSQLKHRLVRYLKVRELQK
nr:MAG TPA: hypothetical protein [Bacteriophage sp.]